MSEEWRPIRGYEGLYEVSSKGRVRSISTGRILSQFTSHDGYQRATLCVGGVNRNIRVHRAVLDSFARPPIEGEVTRHLNGDPADNRIQNLCWGSQSENERDKVRHGTHSQAKRTHCPSGHSYDEHGATRRRRSPKGVTFNSRVCLACHRSRWHARKMARVA